MPPRTHSCCSTADLILGCCSSRFFQIIRPKRPESARVLLAAASAAERPDGRGPGLWRQTGSDAEGARWSWETAARGQSCGPRPSPDPPLIRHQQELRPVSHRDAPAWCGWARWQEPRVKVLIRPAGPECSLPRTCAADRTGPQARLWSVIQRRTDGDVRNQETSRWESPHLLQPSLTHTCV